MDESSVSRLDNAFAVFLTQRTELDKEQGKQFKNIIVRLSYAQSQGHSCLVISEKEREIITLSRLVDSEGLQPLVLLGNQLYLQRYWYYEKVLTKKVVELLKKIDKVKPENEKMLSRYFPSVNTEIDWQKKAASSAVKQYFSIVTGGPGTGKTTTVVKILALLQEMAEQPLNIALAAPTGKAAMRLQESIGNSKGRLICSEEIKSLIPEQVVTLHRLLGARPPSPYFKYNAAHPLVFDVIVIDEASMIDLPLMSKLLDALKMGARLILLGDKDQLASVETGTVLSDLTSALPNNTLELKKSFRFAGNIKLLAEAVNCQNSDDAWGILEQNSDDVRLLDSELIDYIVEKQRIYLDLIRSGVDFLLILAAFSDFQVLSATRKGLNSVDDINLRVREQLAKLGLIKSRGDWYVGRPVMITQNDAVLQLYNGDIGICLQDPENNRQLMVFFLYADGTVRKYFPARLPYCETVFSMTIHKSQGSEFDEVLLVLPEKINPILTKELIYTGITRAKKMIKVLAKKQVFIEALQCKVDRHSGLAKGIKESLK